MVTTKDIDADLTLEIDGQSITPEKFLRGIRAFFGFLSEVTTIVCEDQEPVEWSVQVKSGSNLVGVHPVAGYPKKIVQEIIQSVKRGVETLENRSEEPEHISRKAISYLKELGGIAGVDEDDDTTVRVWIERKPVNVTYKTVAHIAELQKEGYQDHGTVEGKLQTVSERGGFKFVLYEPVWDESIKCYFEDELLKDALKCFGKRVQVSGLIKYRKDGSPTSIKVERIEPFPESEDIPDFRSVRGIFRKIQ